MRPEVYDNELFGVEFRFSGRLFDIGDEATFNKFCNRVHTMSKGSMLVSTDLMNFRVGILQIKVLFYNHGYSPRIVYKTLKFILEEVFPSLAK